ncbi:MAG: site-2 protease family protein [Propionibacteriaceae bacterium]|nr:site-2 protease family protein [Micropruina sp.]
MTDTLVSIAFGLLFFLLIILSIVAHEFGHFLPGKIFNVRITEFFVGFGPKIWSRKVGETEYGIKWILLGGYNKLLGMYPPRREDAPPGWLQNLADEARAAEWEDIRRADRTANRLVYQQKTWKKLVIMAGGITMNLLIAFLCFLSVDALYGQYRPTTTVHEIMPCVLRADANSTICAASDPKSPAAQAGIQAQDVVVAFNGTAITSQPQLGELIRTNLDHEASIVVERAGVRTTLPTVHTVIDGVRDPVDPSTIISAGWLGVYFEQSLVKGGPAEAASDMWTLSKQSVVAIVQLPVKTYNVVVNMVTGKPRDPNSPMSIVGASAAAGQVAASPQLDVGAKAATFGLLLGSLNLFLALFNLVPLPPMDGGHVASAIYEWIRRQVARLRGKPDPGPADTAKLLPVAYAVGALLLLCGAVLIVADILSPIKIL